MTWLIEAEGGGGGKKEREVDQGSSGSGEGSRVAVRRRVAREEQVPESESAPHLHAMCRANLAHISQSGPVSGLDLSQCQCESH